MSLHMPKHRFKAALFFMVYALTGVVAASPFYTWDSVTASSMTVLVPLSANPTIDGAPLGDGDEIGAFSRAGLCVGAVIWDSVHAQSISVVGQDVMSTTTDGLNPGDSIYYRVWHYSTKREALAAVTFSSGKDVYAAQTFNLYIATLTATSSAVTDPVLSAPAKGATGEPLALSLSWGSVSGATTYNVQVSTDGAFGSTVLSLTGLNTPSAACNGLAYSTTYFWRVDASSAAATGFWAGIWSFTTLTAPGAPTLTAPTNGAMSTAQTLSMSWQTVTTATSYGVRVSTVSAFASTIFNQSGLTAASAQVGGLLPGTAYYWQVNAANAAGTGVWSGAWTFGSLLKVQLPIPVAWNTISFNIVPQNDSTGTVFGTGPTGDFLLIKDNAGNIYCPILGQDNIHYLKVGQGYQVYSSMTDTFTVYGISSNIGTMPIALASGWNLIGYLPQAPDSMWHALAGIKSAVIIAKNNAGRAYWPTLGIDNIGIMSTGQGYKVLTSAAVSLTYPTPLAGVAKLPVSGGGGGALLHLPDPVHFTDNRVNTGNNATLLAQRVILGSKTAPDSSEIGAFDAAGHLVGAGTVIHGISAFAIWGNDPISTKKDGCTAGDALAFKLWDGKREYPLDYRPANGVDPKYAADAVYLGSLSVAPGLLISGFDLVTAFPNPFGGSVRITFDIPAIGGMHSQKIDLAVFDMKGSLVYQIARGAWMPGHYTATWNGAGCSRSSGIFVVRMRAENFDKRMKLIKLQ